MNNFVTIYNFNGIIIVYKKDIYNYNFTNDLRYDDTNNIVYIITNNLYENIDSNLIKEKNVILINTDINFELFFNLHSLRHDYLYKNNITDPELILELFNKISLPYDNYPTMKIYNRKDYNFYILHNNLNNCKNIFENIRNLDSENNVYHEIINNKPIENIQCYNDLFDKINMFLNENVEYFKNKTIDFKEYANIYNFEKNNVIGKQNLSNNIVLENVYYINKCWFDEEKKPLLIEDFYKDVEYNEFKDHHCEIKVYDISNIKVNQEIEEEVMFLDYVYGFYNFGEFWDVVKRLLISNVKNLPLFHLNNNRITKINYYFDKLQFKFPTNYTKEERKNKLYYFKKINISNINNSCRGHIDKYFAYPFNKLLNSCQIIEKSYNIYLARGQFGRSIKNEKNIINILKEKYNFIVLNGSESLQDTIHYFTNAKIIFGAHGSLMKNMIWSKKIPVLIELCPHTRHDCFYGNAECLGFLAFLMIVDCDNNEEIILNDEQVDSLYKLLDILCK